MSRAMATRDGHERFARLRTALAIGGWLTPLVAALLVAGAFASRTDALFVVGIAVGVIGVILQLAYRTIAPPQGEGGPRRRGRN